MRTERTNGAPDDGASVVSYDGLSRRRQPQSQFILLGQPEASIGKDNGQDALDREQVHHQARVRQTHLPALGSAQCGGRMKQLTSDILIITIYPISCYGT